MASDEYTVSLGVEVDAKGQLSMLAVPGLVLVRRLDDCLWLVCSAGLWCVLAIGMGAESMYAAVQCVHGR